MSTTKAALLATALIVGCAASVAEVVDHPWSTPSELAALKVLTETFSSACDDPAIAHESGVKASLTTMITRGNPPPIFMNAHEQLASLVVDPVVNAAFAARKGASAVRIDLDPNAIDAGNEVVLATLKDPSIQHVNPFNAADADWYRTIWDAADRDGTTRAPPRTT